MLASPCATEMGSWAGSLLGGVVPSAYGGAIKVRERKDLTPSPRSDPKAGLQACFAKLHLEFPVLSIDFDWNRVHLTGLKTS